MIGIYKLTSPSGKTYIGQSICIRERFSKYKRMNCEDQPKLHNALKKYGVNNFIYEIIEICSRNMLDEREKYYIAQYDSIKNGYNHIFIINKDYTELNLLINHEN